MAVPAVASETAAVSVFCAFPRLSYIVATSSAQRLSIAASMRFDRNFVEARRSHKDGDPLCIQEIIDPQISSDITTTNPNPTDTNISYIRGAIGKI